MGISELTIIKRDGKREAFSVEKIKRAVRKAFLAVGGDPEPGGGGFDGRALFRRGQELHPLPAEAYRGSGDAREARFPHFLLRCFESRHRIEVRRQCQRREQEHRHPHRRASQAELHPAQPASVDRPHQGDVRQGVGRQVPAFVEQPLHLQERRNVDGQLLRFDHDVSVAFERHPLRGRQFHAADQPQVVLRRLRQHGLHRLVDAFRGLRHARVPHVHELLHPAGVRRGLLSACRRGGRPFEEAPHHRQDHYRLFRADRLLDQPAYRCAQLPGRVLERRLL